MSITLPDINLSASKFTLDTLNIQINGCAWLEFLNESPYTLIVSASGINIQIPAWYDYPLQVQEKTNNIWQPISGAQFPVTITAQLLTDQTSFPSTILKTTLYQPGETPANTTPTPLVREVNANVTNAVSVTNTGYAAGTIFVSGTPVGDTVASTIIENNGVAQFGSNQENGSITVTGKDLQSVLIASDSVSALDSTGHFRSSMGAGVFQTEDPSGNIQASLSGTGLTLGNNTAPAGGTLTMYDNSGATSVVIANSGDAFFNKLETESTTTFNGAATANNTFTANSGITFPVGSLSRVSTFLASVTTTLTSFNHNLGVIPDIVIMQLVGTSTTASTGKYDNTSLTTTQVKMIASVAGTFNCIAIKL